MQVLLLPLLVAAAVGLARAAATDDPFLSGGKLTRISGNGLLKLSLRW